MEEAQGKAYVFGSIFTLSNKLQILGDRFDSHLTVKQWLLLAGIHNSQYANPAIGEVARITGNSRQNVKKMLLILEKQGFVAIESDSGDRRVQKVSMTGKCLDYLRQREKNEQAFLDQLFHGFQPSELQELVLGLSKLEQNIASLVRMKSD